jgi:hypothetical protein
LPPPESGSSKGISSFDSGEGPTSSGQAEIPANNRVNLNSPPWTQRPVAFRLRGDRAKLLHIDANFDGRVFEPRIISDERSVALSFTLSPRIVVVHDHTRHRRQPCALRYLGASAAILSLGSMPPACR